MVGLAEKSLTILQRCGKSHANDILAESVLYLVLGIQKAPIQYVNFLLLPNLKVHP